LLVEPPYRPTVELAEDLMLRSLWVHYERFLTARFPDADRLLTTWEDEYDRAQWATFLSALGYRQTAPAVFAKVVAPLQP
jgi:hypothetical protein